MKRLNNIIINSNLSWEQQVGIHGAIDEVNEHFATGWLLNCSTPLSTLKAVAFLHKKEIGRAITTTNRKDIQDAFSIPNKAGFLLKFNETMSYQDYIDDNIKFFLEDETGKIHQIYHQNKSNIEYFTNKTFKGCLDQFTSTGFLSGWARRSKDSAAEVEVYINNNLIDTISANKVRADFVGCESLDVMSGFEYQLDKKYLQGSVSVDVKVNKISLNNSPMTQSFSNYNQLLIDNFLIKDGFLSLDIHKNFEKETAVTLYIDEEAVIDLALSTELNRKIQIPEIFLDGQYHTYRLQYLLGDTTTSTDTVLLRSHDVDIRIESITSDAIQGWFWDNSNRNSDVMVSNHYKITRSEREDVFQAKGLINAGFKIEGFNLCSNESILLTDKNTKLVLAKISISSPYAICRDIINVSRGSIKNIMIDKLLNQSTFEPIYKVEVLPYKKKITNKKRITIIIPVYSGYVETIECIESVLNSKNNFDSRIIIINDCSPDVNVEKYIASVKSRLPKDSLIITKTTNKGFSYAVNIGITLAQGDDIILLNADTVVCDKWIDKLRSAAYSSESIGTVTPLSNNAEICNIPYMCKTLYVDSIETAKKIDCIAELVSNEEALEIPVAVGFCMFIKNDCINEVGLFDYDTWGRGYGEEVDFCMKASALGWKHALNPKTFVIHRGNVSFGDEKLERIKSSSQIISQKYRFYDQMIANFLTKDPLLKYRRKINIALISSFLKNQRVLHISHGYGGGTKKYVDDLNRMSLDNNISSVIVEFNSDGSSKIIFNLKNENKLSVFFDSHEEKFSSTEIEDLKSLISSLSFSYVHLHSPFGMSNEFIDWITQAYKFKITLHDFAWLCKDVNLSPIDNQLCGDLNNNLCNVCCGHVDPHPGLAVISKRYTNIEDYRNYFRQIFSRAEIIIAGGNFVKDYFIRNGYSGKYHVTDHFEDFSALQAYYPPKYTSGSELRVAVIGAISQIKGSKFLEDVAKHALEYNKNVKFIIFGYTNNSVLESLENITITGAYSDNNELQKLLMKFQPHLSFFPNIWPETYSYTLSLAFFFNLYPIVSNLGVPAERVKARNIGTLFDLRSSPQQLIRMMYEGVNFN